MGCMSCFKLRFMLKDIELVLYFDNSESSFINLDFFFNRADNDFLY